MEGSLATSGAASAAEESLNGTTTLSVAQLATKSALCGDGGAGATSKSGGTPCSAGGRWSRADEPRTLHTGTNKVGVPAVAGCSEAAGSALAGGWTRRQKAGTALDVSGADPEPPARAGVEV